MRNGQQESMDHGARNRMSRPASRIAPEESERQGTARNPGGKPPSPQLMIYENAVPVSYARHGDWSLERVTDYTFCRKVNSVPLMVAEFASAALEYAIVFSGNGDAVSPAVVLGARPQENAYVTERGEWQARYIPAFVRRYPFAFSSDDEGNRFTLCIDEAFPGFNRNLRGERLFGEEGSPTRFTENMLTFLQRFQSEFQRTQQFCQKMKHLNLLEPMQAQIKLGSGNRMALMGFSVISRARLKTLSSKVLAELMSSDELGLIYTHLVSMGNFNTLRYRLSAAEGQPDLNASGSG